MQAVKRHGGKSYLAKKIVALFPPKVKNPNKPDPDDTGYLRYVEPYFGGGAVMFANDPEGISEYANDIDEELWTFWTVLQHPEQSADLIRNLTLTPLSQDEYKVAEDPLSYESVIDKAAAFFIRNRQSRQALGKDYVTPTGRCRRGMNEQVSSWLSAVDGLPEVVERMRRVEVWNLPALEVIQKLDSPQTLFYLDPPYLSETRAKGAREYGQHEMSEFDHACLLTRLASLKKPWGIPQAQDVPYTKEQHEFLERLAYQPFKGRFLLSGYRSHMYDMVAELQGWNRHEFEIVNNASSKKTKDIKTECVWTNY